MATLQISLFGALPCSARSQTETRITAKNAKGQLDTLSAQLRSAQADLEDVEYNLGVVKLHQKASSEGRINGDWWDAAIRFGMWNCEEDVEYRSGSYPLKVRRWIRHLLCTLHAERRDVQCAVRDLEPKVAVLAKIIGTQARATGSQELPKT
jgi:hypothetical protein